MNPVQIRHVRNALEERFERLIDLTDHSWQSDEARHDGLMTRGLAALAIQIQHPCSDAEAARAVFDGHDDRGLDAIAVNMREDAARITLVQAKWSRKGKAAFGENEVHKMIHGLNMLLERDFDRFNSRFQRHVPVLEQALDTPSPKITLVLALMRGEPLNSEVRALLEQEITKLNYVEEMVDYEFLDLRDFHQEVLGKSAAPKITLKARVENFGRESDPYKAIFGTVTAPDIAGWFSDHGRGLFARNIRDSLDLTDVNVKIRNTLLEQPEHFWYFSNGITLLCDTIKRTGGSAVPGGVGEFHLSGASVVNGAQTVTAIHRAYSSSSEKAARGRVLVRLISLEDCPPEFGDQVTTNTNTQNPIKDQDFKSLDEAQIQLRDDFAQTLHLSYLIKRGEPPLPDQDKGCSITEAAIALAAAHPNAEFAALAKRDIATLWEDGTYQTLFGANPEAYGVWRRVQLLRTVRARLAELGEGLLWRAAATASYGDLLITHVIFQQLETGAIGEQATDWDAQLAKASDLAEEALGWVMNSIDAEYGKSSQVLAAMRNTERIRRVATRAIRGMTGGRSAPALDAEYQVTGSEEKGRQVDAVRTLVNAGRIPNDTVLEFRPMSRPERREMTTWLEEEPARGQAVWRNSKRDQLQWQADGKWYSPSGLVRKMRQDASGKDRNVQGTLHWHVPGEGSLATLAAKVRDEQGLNVGDEAEEL